MALLASSPSRRTNSKSHSKPEVLSLMLFGMELNQSFPPPRGLLRSLEVARLILIHTLDVPTDLPFTRAALFWHLLGLTRALSFMISMVERLSLKFTPIQVRSSGTTDAENLTNMNIELTTAAFHPDGHLFAAGGADGQIKLFHVKTGESAANFDLGAPVQDITFSENGIWFAAVAKGSNSVVIFDLRKEGKAAEAKVLEIGGTSGQYSMGLHGPIPGGFRA